LQLFFDKKAAGKASLIDPCVPFLVFDLVISKERITFWSTLYDDMARHLHPQLTGASVNNLAIFSNTKAPFGAFVLFDLIGG